MVGGRSWQRHGSKCGPVQNDHILNRRRSTVRLTLVPINPLVAFAWIRLPGDLGCLRSPCEVGRRVVGIGRRSRRRPLRGRRPTREIALLSARREVGRRSEGVRGQVGVLGRYQKRPSQLGKGRILFLFNPCLQRGAKLLEAGFFLRPSETRDEASLDDSKRWREGRRSISPSVETKVDF